jgi:hypothetical protein
MSSACHCYHCPRLSVDVEVSQLDHRRPLYELDLHQAGTANQRLQVSKLSGHLFLREPLTIDCRRPSISSHATTSRSTAQPHCSFLTQRIQSVTHCPFRRRVSSFARLHYRRPAPSVSLPPSFTPNRDPMHHLPWLPVVGQRRAAARRRGSSYPFLRPWAESL